MLHIMTFATEIMVGYIEACTTWSVAYIKSHPKTVDLIFFQLLLSGARLDGMELSIMSCSSFILSVV